MILHSLYLVSPIGNILQNSSSRLTLRQSTVFSKFPFHLHSGCVCIFGSTQFYRCIDSCGHHQSQDTELFCLHRNERGFDNHLHYPPPQTLTHGITNLFSIPKNVSFQKHCINGIMQNVVC